MSNQPPSRVETEHLHRALMRASVEAAALDRRLRQERLQVDPGGLRQHWADAFSALRSALSRVRKELERHGTPRERLDAIGHRLEELQRQAPGFDHAADLGACAQSWDHLAREVALLSGPQRDPLMRLLASRKAQIDRATNGRAQAGKSGRDPDHHRQVGEVQEQRKRAWDRYQRLRTEYLQAGGRMATPGANLAPRAGKPAARAPGALEHRAERFAARLASPRLIERDRVSRDRVADRLEKTLGSLATASRRTLTDPRAGEMRGQLARMDGILSRLQGQSGLRELLAGAVEIGAVLGQMGDLANAHGDAPHLPSFRMLLEERRPALKEALEVGAPKGAEKQRRALPERRRQASDLIEEVLRGVTGARIFADRGAQRGNPQDAEGQEIDPAAVDTWIGSGEGVKRFSEVFGAFLPAEGAPRRGAKRKEPGFFARLFRRVEEFAEGVADAAHAGGTLLGKAMHYTGSGKRRLEMVERAAEKVRDFAGTAEGFLHRMHLGRAAAVARQIGDAATWVDDKSERAQEGLETADEVLGEARRVLGKVESFGHEAAKAFRRAHKGEPAHVLQMGRNELEARAARAERLPAEHRYGQSPAMQTLDLRQPEPDFKLADGEGLGLSQGIHTVKRTRSRGHEAGGKDELPDGEEFLDQVSGRVYDLLMDELEQAFESR